MQELQGAQIRRLEEGTKWRSGEKKYELMTSKFDFMDSD